MLNKKVLITGGSGFIGHHVVEHFLRNTDWDLIVLDRLDQSSTFHRLTDINNWSDEKDRVNFVYHDLKSSLLNEYIIKRLGKIDYIYHLAASSHVDRSITEPMSFIQDNIIGTVNILEYIRQFPVEFFNMFSTDESLGPASENIAFKEDAAHNPKNPYAASKAAAEDICIAYQNTYDLPIFITRTMNVIGERQNPEKFVPLCINKILKGEKIIIHSYPDLKRAGSRFYIHARNVADALLFLSTNFTKGQIYHIVGEKEVDNLSLALDIANIINKPLDYEMVDFHSSRPGHDVRYALDGSKLKALGWEPPKSFDNSLKKTVEWFINHKEWL